MTKEGIDACNEEINTHGAMRGAEDGCKGHKESKHSVEVAESLEEV